MSEDWKSWADNDDSLIVCAPWEGAHSPLAQMTLCSICGTTLCAWPASIEKARDPHWHIVCMMCALMMDIWSELQGDPMKVAGIIEADGSVRKVKP